MKQFNLSIELPQKVGEVKKGNLFLYSVNKKQGVFNLPTEEFSITIRKNKRRGVVLVAND